MATRTDFDLLKFIRESNQIEGIETTSLEDVIAHQALLNIESPSAKDLADFVEVVAFAKMRNKPGLDVRVGDHVAPPGGPAIPHMLEALLKNPPALPFVLHVEYETLHPFMDGNGRSGRALWLWYMRKLGQPIYSSSFLHTFYYQALAVARKP